MQVIDPIFSGLNDEQKRAVETLHGPVLILAGAGSGKTRTITHRIAYLMNQGVRPWEILAVTFTNRAAKELKERIARILKLSSEQGTDPTHLPVSGTFHSICVRILRRDIEHIGRNRDFVIYDSDDQEKLMKEALAFHKIAPEEMKPKTALGHISRYKSEAIEPSEAKVKAVSGDELKIVAVYQTYNEMLKTSNAVDFDDLLLLTVRLFRSHPQVLERYQNTWKYLHVDEYQDTNHVQYLLLQLLAGKHRNLCVIGDPDQSIYAFRGADIRNILDFTKEYGDAVAIKLERNYRSTQQVLDAADGVIQVNPNRPKKKMWTDRTDGAKVLVREVSDERREAELAVEASVQQVRNAIPLQDQVVLYRTNAQSRLLEEACMRAGVPYRIIGGVKFYARREVKDVLAYLSLVQNPQDTIALLRIINVPSRKIGATTLEKLQQFANDRAISLWGSLGEVASIPELNEPTIRRLSDFREKIVQFRAKAETHTVGELTRVIIHDIGLESWLRDDTEEGETRWENVQELLSVTKKYDHLLPQESLMSFLEEVSLISETDNVGIGSDALTLMTLHLCKGLEFERVTIVGCEEGLLPHSSADFDREQLEEERRLMYVGMTRAKSHLTLLYAMQRTLWGNTQQNLRSRFLDDVPVAVIEPQSDSMTSRYAWIASSHSPAPKPVARPRISHGFEAEDENQDWMEHLEHALEEGTRIEHKTLGIGTVLRRSGDVIDVKFDAGQTKKLAVGIAPIKIAH
ncbi:MAG: UvrD-helicase domain-containing protein [Candidatus Peribacteraceae bacterium]